MFLELPSSYHPSITPLPTGTEIQSSASGWSIVAAGVFSLEERWIDRPDAPEITAVAVGLDNVLPKAVEFLGQLPKPTDGAERCKSRRCRRDESKGVASLILDKRSIRAREIM
jgi:hypothetical protein